MKRRASLARTLAELRKAEDELRELRGRAAAERARELAHIHRRFGFSSRKALIAALVALEAPPRQEPRSSSSKADPAASATHAARRAEDAPSARRRAANLGEQPAALGHLPTGVPASKDAMQQAEEASTLHSSKRAAVGPMRAAPDERHLNTPDAPEPGLPTLSLPIEVRRLLDSEASRELRWGVPDERHAIVVEILTRGDAVAERWLWEHNTREEIRSLVRRFGGNGYDDEARAVLRRKMGLSERDVPARPFRAPAKPNRAAEEP